MKNNKTAMIQTVVLSVFLPFMYAAAFVGIMDGLYSTSMLVLTLLTAIGTPAAYYFVVLHWRKGDTDPDLYKKRMRVSLWIQTGVSLAALFLPLAYTFFCVPLENGHWTGEVPVVLFFFLIEPICVHISGLLFHVFMTIVS